MLTSIEKMILLNEFRTLEVRPSARQSLSFIVEALQADLLDGGRAFERLCHEASGNATIETNSFYG